MLTLCYKLFRNIIVKKIFPMVKVKIVLLIMVGELTNANTICNINRTIIRHSIYMNHDIKCHIESCNVEI